MKPKETEKTITPRKTKEQHKEELRDIDINGLNMRLQASEREGYVRRFVKDKPQRIAQMQRLGYDFAQDSKDEVCGTISGSRLGANLGQTREGPGTKGFLMEIPKERYEAIQELKQEAADALEDQMRAGHHEEQAGDNRYVPKGGIRIGRK
jgi:hypothetical protein